MQTFAAAGVPEPAVGFWVQVPGASAKLVPARDPTLEKVTVVTWFDPGVSGVAVPPYLSMVAQVALLVDEALE